jgi:hypothetical protein
VSWDLDRRWRLDPAAFQAIAENARQIISS